jgi:hypothetical protein
LLQIDWNSSHAFIPTPSSKNISSKSPCTKIPSQNEKTSTLDAYNFFGWVVLHHILGNVLDICTYHVAKVWYKTEKPKNHPQNAYSRPEMSFPKTGSETVENLSFEKTI